MASKESKRNGRSRGLSFDHAVLKCSPRHHRRVMEAALDWRDANRVSRSAADRQLRKACERVEQRKRVLRPAPSSVREAVELAEREFGWNTLLFLLNSASNVDTRFKRPVEVWLALRWLATDYRSARIEGGMPNPDQSLREACPGWSYASDNSAAAMSKYPAEYKTTRQDGRVYELGHHIRRGRRNDERQMVRIAFAWDKVEERVVIGYVGKHQRNGS